MRGLPALRSGAGYSFAAGAATRVTIVQPGYRTGEPWETVYRHFERGNGWSLEQLRRRFARRQVPAARLRTVAGYSFAAGTGFGRVHSAGP